MSKSRITNSHHSSRNPRAMLRKLVPMMRVLQASRTNPTLSSHPPLPVMTMSRTISISRQHGSRSTRFSRFVTCFDRQLIGLLVSILQPILHPSPRLGEGPPCVTLAFAWMQCFHHQPWRLSSRSNFSFKPNLIRSFVSNIRQDMMVKMVDRTGCIRSMHTVQGTLCHGLKTFPARLFRHRTKRNMCWNLGRNEKLHHLHNTSMLCKLALTRSVRRTRRIDHHWKLSTHVSQPRINHQSVLLCTHNMSIGFHQAVFDGPPP